VAPLPAAAQGLAHRFKPGIMPNPVYIYDAVRTPRSKGKSTGTLHEVKPIDLAAGLLVELQQRQDLDTSYVDDVVMGCVTPDWRTGFRHCQDDRAKRRLG
jgi:acetyl-CoA acetyltransferase